MRRLKGWAGHNHRTAVPIGGPDGDLEYRFTHRDQYPKLDREALFAEVEMATEYGKPLDLQQYREKRTSTRFEKLKRQPRSEEAE